MPKHPLKIYEDLDPKLLDLVNNTRDLALADGALPRKIKLLIAMVLDAVHVASDGVRALANQAMMAGQPRKRLPKHYVWHNISMEWVASILRPEH